MAFKFTEDMRLNNFSRLADGAPVPPASEWPDATNTGPRTPPTIPITGDFTTTSAGQIISGIDLKDGTLIVAHPGVRFRDSRISETASVYALRVLPGADDFEAEYCELADAQTGVQGHGKFTALNIHHVENGFVYADGTAEETLVEETWIHDFFAPIDPHFDAIASQGGSSNLRIRHCNIDGGAAGDLQGVFVTTEFGPTDNVIVENTRIVGCSYNIVFGTGVTNPVATGNLLERGTNGYYNIGAGVTPTLSGNVSTRGYWIDGDPVPTVGDVAFVPSVGSLPSNDANVNFDFRVACRLDAVGGEFRVVFQSSTHGSDMRGMAAGKQSTPNVSALPLAELEFGGITLAAEPLEMLSRRQLVSDWGPMPAGFSVGDVMIVGIALENPGGTALASANTNVDSYFNPAGTGYDAAAPGGYTASAGNDFGVLRIEVR